MKICKIFLFVFILIASFPKTMLAQVDKNIAATDTTDDDDDSIVDPDYKPLTKSGNTVNGKWYGIGNVVTTNHSNSYLCELLLKEDKKGKVTGYFNYFFRDGYFSNKLYGTYDKAAQTFKFKPVIVLYHQTTRADIGVDVPMYGNFILNLNSKDTTLTGFLTPISNYKYLVPALNIKLSIVDKKEPTLKERVRKRKLELEEDADVATVLNEAKSDSAKSEQTAQNNKNNQIVDTKKTYENDHVKNDAGHNNNYKNDTLKFGAASSKNKGHDVVKTQNQNNTGVGHDIIKSNTASQQTKGRDIITFKNGDGKKSYASDTIKQKTSSVVKGRDTIRPSGVKPLLQRDTLKFGNQTAAVSQAVEEEYKKRSTNLINTLTVKDDSVTISLYDNGEFDHDMVSVFFNGKLVASNIELKTNAAAKFVVYLDATPGAKNELTLFAENLGTIPPNSALMIIEDTHGNRYEVTLKSDLSHNASVLLTPRLE
ncbi:MAG: hypothetical protein DI598_06670 [Pseudopedobacter saltans]|uniref:Uncharacterized protein n=1 Tax=Pseudopedobacter saltans TaxID=151895 RepID=A0A2W5F146_9SPHI|nr:MAG: hypothetical protein DI598_06670 [Pseudopedobacter saltans]